MGDRVDPSALGFFILVAALILNFSRAGILILVGGCAIWLAVMAFRQKSAARIAIGVSLVLILLQDFWYLVARPWNDSICAARAAKGFRAIFAG